MVFATITLPQQEAWKQQAKVMVDKQIRARGVKDTKLLNVMESTPRHLFVPMNQRYAAYQDRPLPIGQAQTISQPYVVALMTELLDLKSTHKVLEIGTGSGYQAAVLSALVDRVYTIEIVKEHADSSRVRLSRLGYNNILVKWGDGYLGWPEYAPYDAIIVTAAPPEIPPKLLEQLKPGGQMVLPVGRYFQELKLITKTTQGEIRERSEGGVRFVPMVHPK